MARVAHWWAAALQFKFYLFPLRLVCKSSSFLPWKTLAISFLWTEKTKTVHWTLLKSFIISKVLPHTYFLCFPKHSCDRLEGNNSCVHPSVYPFSKYLLGILDVPTLTLCVGIVEVKDKVLASRYVQSKRKLDREMWYDWWDVFWKPM